MEDLEEIPKFLSKEDAAKLNILLRARKKNKIKFARVMDRSTKTISRWCNSSKFPFKKSKTFLGDLEFSENIEELKKKFNDKIDNYAVAIKNEFNIEIDKLQIKFKERFEGFKK